MLYLKNSSTNDYFFFDFYGSKGPKSTILDGQNSFSDPLRSGIHQNAQGAHPSQLWF